MNELHITGAGRHSDDLILVELSDGKSLTFSLKKLLTLVPDFAATPEDAEKDDA